MPVANDKGFLEWVQFLKVYEKKGFKQINDREFEKHSNNSNIDISEHDLNIIETSYVRNQYSREFNRKFYYRRD